MTKTKALYEFFSSFGVDAYPNTSVPDGAVFPYLTYDVSMGDWGDINNIAVNLYYYTESEAQPMAKVEQIAKAIGYGGVQISCDDGTIWVTKGSPWCIAVPYEGNSGIKQRQLNMTLLFNTI